MDRVVKPKSLGGYIRCISGLFMTKDNPNGLSPKECTILAQIVFILKQQGKDTIDKEVKQELSNINNHTLQVSTNYVNKLKRKNTITKDNKLHQVFNHTKMIVQYEQDVM